MGKAARSQGQRTRPYSGRDHRGVRVLSLGPSGAARMRVAGGCPTDTPPLEPRAGRGPPSPRRDRSPRVSKLARWNLSCLRGVWTLNRRYAAFACGVAGNTLLPDRVGWDERPPAWERFMCDISSLACGLPCGRTGPDIWPPQPLV